MLARLIDLHDNKVRGKGLAHLLQKEIHHGCRGFWQNQRDHLAKSWSHSGSGTDELLQLVEQQHLDFAVVGMTFDRGKPPATLVVRDIFRDQLHILVAPHHPLAQHHESSLLLEQVAGEPLVLLREGFGARRVIERVFAQRNLPVQPVAEADMLEGVIAFVKLGVGVTFVPPTMIRSSQRAELIALSVADLKEEFVFALVQRRFGVPSAAANVMMKTLLNDLKPDFLYQRPL